VKFDWNVLIFLADESFVIEKFIEFYEKNMDVF
jgi:hypothetical protein